MLGSQQKPISTQYLEMIRESPRQRQDRGNFCVPDSGQARRFRGCKPAPSWLGGDSEVTPS
jgi:hypothetical protein